MLCFVFKLMKLINAAHIISYIKGGMQAEGFEERILRRIFGNQRDENGEWRGLHNEVLHSLYRSPNIVRVIRPKSLRWAGHVAQMDDESCALPNFNK